MTITEYALFIILGLGLLLALTKLQEATKATTTRNPFASNPDDAII